jgi:uroporphyrin-III C-methyltransferase
VSAAPVVHLVGAGPGDPELLTLRAARLLAEADVVVHDQLVPEAVLAHVRPGAEVLAAGRRCGRIVVAHPAVVDRLAHAALAGRRVVRLKGGDPVVFGRGGEETLELAARGVATELVPGVSSVIAAPELAGIPLTHRGVSTGFLVLTGRRAAHEMGLDGDWDLAARFSGTVVVLMGGGRLAELCGELVARGRDGATPAAIIASAGCPGQQVVSGTLHDLPGRARAAQIGTPAVLVVGDVVEVLRPVSGTGLAAPVRSARDGGRQRRRTSTAASL